MATAKTKITTSAVKKNITPNISELTQSFLLSAIDHACNDAKSPLHIVSARFEEWKQTKMNIASEDQQLDEKYIINYSNERNEYEEAYKEWYSSRVEIIQKSKNTNKIGEQEIFIKELAKIPFPDVLSTPITDIYTKYKPNQ